MKNKIGSIILSVVIAFGLWLYVITVENPQKEQLYSGVPVRISGEAFLTDRGLMITSGTNSTVNVRVSGSRTDLSKLSSSSIICDADVSNIFEAGEFHVTYSVSYPGNFANGALKTQSRTPDSVTLMVEEKITKTLEIEPVYVGSTPEDYWINKEEAVLDSETITVSGPKSVMDQITRAIITVDLTDRTQSFSEVYRPTLCNNEGEPVDLKGLVEASVGEVRLELRIQRFKELELRLTVMDGGGATEATSNIEIMPSTIRVSGSETVLDGLDYIELGILKLGELEGDTELTYEIYLPEGVTNLSGVTDAVVKVSFPMLQIREFKVENIRAVNVPEGMEVEFLTQSLTVKLRGSAGIIQNLTASDIVVTVDFANAEAGTATMKASITVSSRFPGVGEIGSYIVSATLRVAADDGNE